LDPEERRRTPEEFSPADHQFMTWWRLFVVERYPIHEKPQAWVMMMLSLHMQNRIKPFD